MYYRHSDWLGSSRLTSTAATPTSRYFSTAYAPFGEQYASSGTADISFTGQDQNTLSSLYDFQFRRQSPSQGRWTAPDPAGAAAVDPTSPQSWNRYAYVLNNPLSLVDPLGLSICDWDASLSCGPATDDGGGGGGGGPVYVVDGVAEPAWLGQTLLGSGAGLQCPNNNCNGITLQANGEFYRNTYSPDLVLNCNGASTSDYACWWSNWSKQFVENADDLYVHSSMGFWGGAISYGPRMADLWRNSSGAANTALVATGVAIALPVAAGEVAGATVATEDLVTVSRWGSEGLEAGYWVMNGEADYWNYLWSGKWDPMQWNEFAPFSSGQEFTVPGTTLQWPEGWEFIKGVLGQRLYIP